MAIGAWNIQGVVDSMCIALYDNEIIIWLFFYKRHGIIVLQKRAITEHTDSSWRFVLLRII